MTRAPDIQGQRFGMLTIIERAPNAKAGTGVAARWRYKCDCGNEGVAFGGSLRSGASTSCGCKSGKKHGHRPRPQTRHGHTWRGGQTPTYTSWKTMLGRCENPNHHKFPLYGALGVRVCDRWHRFENFLTDMGERPEGKSIDRFPNKSGNYEPGNCRWATLTEQNNNKRTTLFVEYLGARMSIGEATRKAGVLSDPRAAHKRVKRGWTVERAVETPLR